MALATVRSKHRGLLGLRGGIIEKFAFSLSVSPFEVGRLISVSSLSASMADCIARRLSPRGVGSER